MIRVVLYLILLAVLAWCGVFLIHHPGHVTLDWFGAIVTTSAALLIAAVAVAAVLVWTIVRFVLGFPSFVSVFARQRRREKGYAALSRGLIAVGAGDAKGAFRASAQASRHLRNDPLAMMLRAQTAHLNDDGAEARESYGVLARREDTRLLGLRGLHADAIRRGDDEAARHFAAAAHAAAPLPWSAQAVLEHRASSGDWERALATVETSISAKLIDKATGERQRAVLQTAIAYDKELSAPEEALKLARTAIRRAPDLVPAIVLAASLMSRRGDIAKASKLIEASWARVQHPDIARVYLDVRPGDSTTDRLQRAKTLMGIAAFDPVSRMTVARAALAMRDFAQARAAMAPLIVEGKQPSVRMCMTMAELEEGEHGDHGQWREWLARASRAPLDPAWVADGVVYDHWAPASPTSGRLDAFRWQVPAERLGPAMDAVPLPSRPRPTEIDAVPIDAVKIESAAVEPATEALPSSARQPAKDATVSDHASERPVAPSRPLFHRPDGGIEDERHRGNGVIEAAPLNDETFAPSGLSEEPAPNAGDAHPPPVHG